MTECVTRKTISTYIEDMITLFASYDHTYFNINIHFIDYVNRYDILLTLCYGNIYGITLSRGTPR